MTESRKLQLETAVDATGAKEGFDQVKQGARDMAQAVAEAGKTAGKGMDAIPDGAKRATEGLTREQSRMKSLIERSTLELRALGKTASQKIEIKADLKGIDISKLEPQLAVLRQIEAEQARAAAGAKGQAFIGDLQGQIAALREQAHLQSLSANEALRYKAALAGVGTSAEPLIAELGHLRAAHAAVTKAALEQADAEKEAARAAAARGSFVSRVQTQANSIGKSNADLLAEEAAVRGVSAQLAPYIAKIREAEKSHQGLAASGKLSAYQLQQVHFQLHDFVVQVASGQSALTAFFQQGSQLSGTFDGSGNALKAVLSLLTPVRAALIGAAAAGGVLALSLAHAETAARGLNTLQAQLSGTGRSNLFSTDELRSFIKELALAPGVSREAATGIVSELSKVKDIGGGLFRDLAKSAADYAKATGTDVPTAAKALARAFADPEKGAKLLDDALGSLTSTQIIAIEKLTKVGDIAGAQRVLFEALQKAVNGLASNGMTPLQKSVDELGNSWERAMTKMDQSEGLRNINTLLGKIVEAVTWVINHADEANAKIRPLLAVATLGGSEVARAALGKQAASTGGATGSFDTPGGATGSFGSPVKTAKVGGDEEIKRAREAAKAYKGQAGELSDLSDERKRFNSALAESIRLYGKDSDQAKEFRQAIVGVDEKMAAVRKRGQRSGGNETQQVLDAELQQSISAAKDALEKERDNLAFSQRYLQTIYQAGELSLKDFYAEKTKAIEQGVASQIAAFEVERAAVEKHLADTKRTSPKDKSAIVNDEKRLQGIDADIEKARVDGQRQVVLSNEEAKASFKALDEQVLQYQASLKSLQGDEIGAARIRDEIARKQLAVLAGQSGGAISKDDQAKFATAQRQVSTLNVVKTQTGAVNQQLQIEEERIALGQRTGAIGEIQALQQLGAVRAQAVTELEKIVKAQEEVAKSRPEDYQLQIDTSRARLELDKLKADLDPLKEKFDNLLKDAGANAFESLAAGGKPKDVAKAFGSAINKELSGIAGKQFSEQVFGKDGIFGGLGGKFADAVGGKDRNKPSIETSGVTGSFNRLQASGIDPTINAFSRLVASIDSAAGSVGKTSTPTTGDFARLDRGQASGDTTTLPTGDLARLDRGQTSGEDAVMDLFRDAGKANENYAATSAQSAAQVLQLASAASKGGSALGLLPSLIGLIQSAISSLTASSGGSGGGNLLGSLGSLFGGGSSANAFGGASSAGFGTGAGFGNLDYGMFLHTGGIVGQTSDKRPVDSSVFLNATRYHTGGTAGHAPNAIPLKPNEVPTVLLRNEEVLTESDPRHRDNLAPEVMSALNSGPAAPKLFADVGRLVAPTVNMIAGGDKALERSAFIERVLTERAVPSVAASVKEAAGVINAASSNASASVLQRIAHQDLYSPQRAGWADERSAGVQRKGGVDQMLRDMPRYHAGGIVERVRERANGSLKPNEVPAVLMGGPKGIREEVLHASDPRHRDNLRPEVASLIAAMPRYHTGGLVGSEPNMRVETYRPNAMAAVPASSERDSEGEHEDRQAGPVHLHFYAAKGMTPQDSRNRSREMERELQSALASRSKKT